MKRLSIFLLLNILILSTAVAQAPGYMGKKLAIKYNLNTFPTSKYTIGDFKNQNLTLGSPINGLNIQHEAVLEYALFKKSTVGLILSSSKAGFWYEEFNSNFNYINRIGKINQKGYGVFFRAYSGGSLALVGKYFQIDYSLLKTNLEYYNNISKSVDLNGFLLGITFGTQKILFDRLIYEIGFRSSMAVNSSILNSDYDVAESRRRMFNGHLILIKFGIGTLVI